MAIKSTSQQQIHESRFTVTIELGNDDQPTNAEDAAAGNENAIRHTAYANGYADGVAAERKRYADERTLLLHKMEQLQVRLVKRLTNSADMLEVGLSAIRKHPLIRAAVMVERAEFVVKELRAEVYDLLRG